MNIEFWKNKKVFITGHTGFKGTWLSSLLVRMSANIYGYSNSFMKKNHLFGDLIKNSKNINTIIGDINNKDLLEENILKIKPDIVFHLAAQPLVIDSYKDPLMTWKTNLIGTLNLLESLRNLDKKCIIVIITSDKVYKNNNWEFNYRENDILGGKDPYSASKAACEIAVESWKESFIGKEAYQNPFLKIASARAGNVIGGGDWSENRLVPDIMKSLRYKSKLLLRNPDSTRPWQHVLDPICGYISLAEYLWECKNEFISFNFGPSQEDVRNVKEVLISIQNCWGNEIKYKFQKSQYYEPNFLGLNYDRALKIIGWKPTWNFDISISETVKWYKNVFNGEKPSDEINKCLERFLKEYE